MDKSCNKLIIEKYEKNFNANFNTEGELIEFLIKNNYVNDETFDDYEYLVNQEYGYGNYFETTLINEKLMSDSLF